MSIYIKNVEMPTDHPLWIVVHSDGTVEANGVSASRPVGWQTLRNAAVPIPPHGRLIDADALRCLYDPHDYGLDGEQADEYDRYHVSLPVIRQNIDDMPTIIEVEEGEL